MENADGIERFEELFARTANEDVGSDHKAFIPDQDDNFSKNYSCSLAECL